MLWRNDYSNFFEIPGDYFTTIGIASFAYDQRGFGRGAGRGSWAEINQYTRDLVEFTLLIRDRYPVFHSICSARAWALPSSLSP